MIILRSWLSEFFPHFQLENVPDLAHRLTMGGLEVESVRNLGEGLEGVVIGNVLKKEKHPDADRLTVCEVDVGKERLSIVCGAANVREKLRVAVATVGTKLPNGITIKPSKIRGVTSQGMICSESELGLAETSDGILELPDESVVGTPIVEALDLKDEILEIGITPNRGDCLSYIGVAREVAAVCRKEGAKLVLPTANLHEISQTTSQFIRVEIEDQDACPRYTARIVRNLKIGPSPLWLQQRLQRNGIRPISNVVDITNYVMLEMGQPLHAFDLNQIKGGEIHVRSAKEGEEITTLDRKVRILKKGDILICDGTKPIALAGVIGGASSEVSPSTTAVLIESAFFSPTKIRLTSRRLNLISESSYRFERGVDPEGVIKALNRAAHLISEICNGEVLNGALDSYSKAGKKTIIGFRPKRSLKLLGDNISAKESGEILSSLGFHIKSATADILQVEVPSWRTNDIFREVDLIEEVARVRGYDAIPPTLPGGKWVENILPPEDALLSLKDRLTDCLVKLGWYESINLSFVSPSVLKLVGNAEKQITLLNPIGEEFSILRPTLLPSVLNCVGRNIALQNRDLKLFELRTIFLNQQGAEVPEERYHLTAVMTGKRAARFWGDKEEVATFFDIKGELETAIKQVKREVEFQGLKEIPKYLHPTNHQGVIISNEIIGWVGEIHPEIVDRFKIDQRVFAFDMDVTALLETSEQKITYKPISKFPIVTRDISVIMPREVEAAGLMALISENKPANMTDFDIFDLYEGKNIPSGKKSIAISLTFSAQDRTLTDEEVDRALQKLLACIQKNGLYELRV